MHPQMYQTSSFFPHPPPLLHTCAVPCLALPCLALPSFALTYINQLLPINNTREAKPPELLGSIINTGLFLLKKKPASPACQPTDVPSVRYVCEVGLIVGGRSAGWVWSRHARPLFFSFPLRIQNKKSIPPLPDYLYKRS